MADTAQAIVLDIDWSQWRRQFGLDPSALYEIPSLFPAIAAADEANTPAVSAQMLLDIAAAENDPSEPEALFEAYLEQGELAAASAMLHRMEAAGVSAEQLRARVAERRNALELDMNRALADFAALQQQLVKVGLRGAQDAAYEADRDAAVRLREIGRVGTSIHVLRRKSDDLRATLAEHTGQLDREIKQIESAAGRSPDLSQKVAQQLERAGRYRATGDDDLAAEAIREARVLVETNGTLTQAAAEMTRPEREDRYRLREAFPSQVRAKHIVGWLRRGEQPNVQGWAEFVGRWLPADWRQGRGTIEDPAFTAIERLADASEAASPMTANIWANLAKDLFDLVGRRNQEPRQFEDLLTRPVPPRSRVGFWLGYCAPSLAVRGTFLDPGRFHSRGLPVLVWHRPRDPFSPSPTSLETYLESRNLRDGPVLVLADEPVDPEDALSLRSSATAALLDESMLLQILLSPSDLPAHEDSTRVRQLHFAAAVSSQLPASQASPFHESGAASRTMFFGRRDVLSEFRDPEGPTILYGGRKLGKSSILKELERRFVEDDPEHHVALTVDCSNAGTSEESVLRMVQEITDGLARYDPPASGVRRSKPFRGTLLRPTSVTAFVEQLSRLLADFPKLRVLLLLDEADALCAYLDVPPSPQLTQGQRLGWDLRKLVADSKGRFDVRFAGFQEIRRAAVSTNGPFFNFRRGRSAWALKVFHPDEAEDLLVSTLRGLAVEFAGRTLIERVLEFTGRHPALLQDFGRRLYFQVRARNARPPWQIRSEDVDAVILDPEFRRQVVRTVHLNVSRGTRPQRVLKLLLYLWVQQVMAPSDGTPREARTARDLWELLGDALGEEAQRELDVSAIASYLGDLEVLGVLERRGEAYAFAYRAFATLLYHDHFAGGLGERIIREAWTDVRTDTHTVPRLWIPAGQGYTLSPLPREAQDRLLRDSNHMPLLIMGPAGTGLTTAAEWLAKQAHPDAPSSQPRPKHVTVPSVDAAGLRAALADAIGIGGGADWATFQASGLERARSLADHNAYSTIVLDDLNSLAEADEEPLFIWETFEAQGEQPAHVFSLLQRLAVESRGRLRFLFTGSLPAARLWVSNVGVLAEEIAWFRTERLNQAEVGTWMEAVRLMVSDDETRTRVWEASAGDWRILVALNQWLRIREGVSATAETEVLGRHVDEFRTMLRDTDRRRTEAPELEKRIVDAETTSLRVLMAAADAFGIDADFQGVWRDACLDVAGRIDPAISSWSGIRWEQELKALLLLREVEEDIAPESGAKVTETRLLVRTSDPWLSLLRGR